MVLRNFVSLARGLTPKTLDNLLCRFIAAARDAIVDQAGRTVRVEATGITAHFMDGPGDHNAYATRAIEAAMAVMAAARRVKQWAEAELTGQPAPELSIGCGVHKGEIILARLSTSGQAAPSMVGQTVDVAYRLNGRAKGLGWSIAASQAALGLTGARFQLGRHATLADTDYGIAIPIAEIVGLNPGIAKPGELPRMAEAREALLANTMLASFAGDADQQLTERTIVVTAKRSAPVDPVPTIAARRVERELSRGSSWVDYLAIHVATGGRFGVCAQEGVVTLPLREVTS